MIKKDKLFELKIEEDDDVSGIDSISLVDEPAIEINWMYFNKVKPQEFHIPDGEDNKYLEKLKSIAQDEQELLDEGWVISKVEPVGKSTFAVNATQPNAPSEEDEKEYKVRYKYVLNPEAQAPAIIPTTRDFCRELIQKNYVWRLEDMDSQLNDEGDSALVWRGGYNCRHLWARIEYTRDATIINKASVNKGKIDPQAPLDTRVLGLEQPDTRVPEWPSFSKQGFERVSIDYDDTLATQRGKDLARKLLLEGKELVVVTRRRDSEMGEVRRVAKEVGIDKVYNTNGRLKWAKLKELGIQRHIDNSMEEIDAIKKNAPLIRTQKFAIVCPEATQDVAVNLENRQECIDVANYGPLNPNEPNEDYWKAKAKMFEGDVASAKKSLCGNCAFFVQTKSMLDCIAGGINDTNEWDTIDAGDLGYCEAFDFKCAASRTCDAWVVGGPIVEENMESVSDYPDSVKNNAKRGIELNEKNGNKCATQVGKVRAQQLANGEPISLDTVKRMYSYLSRASEYYDEGDTNACGTISYLLWGGKSALSWAESKLNNFGYDVSTIGGYTDPNIKKKKKQKKFAADEEKRTIVGPAMVPDLRIPRRTKDGDMYEVYFSADTIKMIAEKYMKNQYTRNNDLMHDGTAVKDVYVIESWIKEDMEDKSNKYGYGDLPVGTWFVAMKVAKTPEGDKVWEMVKSGELAGYSVSGWFEEVAAFCREEMFLQKVVEVLKKYK
jgi:hypothetical protein